MMHSLFPISNILIKSFRALSPWASPCLLRSRRNLFTTWRCCLFWLRLRDIFLCLCRWCAFSSDCSWFFWSCGFSTTSRGRLWHLLLTIFNWLRLIILNSTLRGFSPRLSFGWLRCRCSSLRWGSLLGLLSRAFCWRKRLRCGSLFRGCGRGSSWPSGSSSFEGQYIIVLRVQNFFH